jgi:HlyD family secretion protein/adhesin transport system membrane fusion protein
MNLRSWVHSSRKAFPAEHFTLPLELEDGRPARFHLSLLRLVMLALAIVALWASMTPIRELAIAPGVVVPEGDIRSVQHLEGGIVASMPVQAGMRVRAGDTILVLADDQAARDLGQLAMRARSLALQKQQILALLTASELELRPSLGADAELIAAHQGVFAARRRARQDENRTFSLRIQQKQAEIDNASNELEGARRLVAIQEERVEMRRQMSQKGLGVRSEFLADQATLEHAKSQKTAAEGRLAIFHQQLSEAQNQASSAEADARRGWSEDMARIAGEHGEVTEAIGKLTDKVDRLTIHSPVDGVVQFLAVRSKGDVVKPGDVVARVVPVDVPLTAEVEVRADDVGHVRVGDPASIRVSTFDPSIYGKLKGKVTAVSASSFQRQNGDYFFRATIALEVDRLASQTPVSAGMVVSAEIITGAKSFTRYLLKAVFKNFDQAFSEK